MRIALTCISMYGSSRDVGTTPRLEHHRQPCTWDRFPHQSRCDCLASNRRRRLDHPSVAWSFLCKAHASLCISLFLRYNNTHIQVRHTYEFIVFQKKERISEEMSMHIVNRHIKYNAICGVNAASMDILRPVTSSVDECLNCLVDSTLPLHWTVERHYHCVLNHGVLAHREANSTFSTKMWIQEKCRWISVEWVHYC